MRLYLTLVLSGFLLAQQSSLDAAWDLVAKGDRQGAIRILEQILKTKPSDGDARLLLGSIFSEEGRTREAITQLTEAARLMPRAAMAHNALGETLKSSGNLNGARAAFEKAVALDPSFGQAHANLGAALLEANESAQAATYLDRALKIFGQTPDAAYPLYLRAKIYTNQDEPEKAAQLLTQAVSLQSDFGEAWSDLGQARKRMLDDTGAFVAFQHAVKADPQNAISQYRLGAEYLNHGKPHEAVMHLQESYRLDPKNQSTLYSLQLALRRDGRLDEAKKMKEQLSEMLRSIDKESQDAFTAVRLNNEGSALEKAGDLTAAVEKYRAARDLNPEHIGFRLNYGVALLRLGRWKEGLAELQEASQRDPTNAQVKSALEDALRQAPVEFGGKAKKPAVK